jgi:hypothetical protein
MKPISMRRAVRTAAGGACQLTLLLLPSTTAPVEAQTLERFAALPADTFAPGPTSGQFISPANGRTPPFAHKQPVQGVSSGAARARRRLPGDVRQRVRRQIPLGQRRIGVLNDNNYPFSSGRTDGQPDDTSSS